MFSRRQMIIGAAALAASPAFAQADRTTKASYDLFFGGPPARRTALAVLIEHGPEVAPILIFAFRFSNAPAFEIEEALRAVTGDDGRNGWFEWMLWQEGHADIPTHPAYFEVKRAVFMALDPRWEPFLAPEYLTSMDIRFEEVAWGGVRRDGIPSLDFPNLIAGEEASYLKDDDLVFGVEINGDIRAYPLRIMGWHEMFNEVIGGVPVALAYCTLCGAGVLFETDVEGQAEPFVMGTSGFLYRSNKLMYDRQTESLWNQFTGKPVSGALRGSGIELSQRPVVIERWADWFARNPATKVLSLQTGHSRDYGSGVVYNEYFASSELMFPARSDESRLARKDFVFGVRTFAASKAWPISAFREGRVINDQVGALRLVLIGDAASRTVRAYDRGDLRFQKEQAKLISDGATWKMTEAALVSDDGRTAARVAGHIAYWFAWDGYHGPRSELFDG